MYKYGSGMGERATFQEAEGGKVAKILFFPPVLLIHHWYTTPCKCKVHDEMIRETHC